jgi:FtsH-binding integral membrane protein
MHQPAKGFLGARAGIHTQRKNTMKTALASLTHLVGPIVLASIAQFFSNLLNQGLTPFALAAAAFFFAWAAILYMSAGTENTRRLEQAKSALYAALTGLALALLANTIASIISAAARGQ